MRTRKSTFMYPVTWYLFRLYRLWKLPMVVVPSSVKPPQGPVIVIANHTDLRDTWLVSTLFKQRIAWFASKNIFKRWFLVRLVPRKVKQGMLAVGGRRFTVSVLSRFATLVRWSLVHCGPIPVVKDNPKGRDNLAIVSALKKSVAAGWSIGIFPQGGIKPKEQMVNFRGLELALRVTKYDVVQVYVDYARQQAQIYRVMRYEDLLRDGKTLAPEAEQLIRERLQ
jgi:1-acyl-sn-glycerol-3-phosphate acyltransferase